MSCNSSTERRSFSARRIGCALLLPLLLICPRVRAQEAIRPSLAGEAAAEARRQSLDEIPYNMLIGPVRFRVSATAGVEYNDNINIAEVNTEEDFIFRPQVNFNMLWPVTQLNTLRFDIGMSYAFYADHSENNTNGILLTPGSQLSFDVFVSDFRINFHDRFSLEQDPIGEAQLSGVVDYGRFQNTAGISVLWDLNKAVLTVGYDHYNFIATNSDFDYLDRNSEELSASLSFAASSTTGVGLESSYVFTNYDRDVLNDNHSFSVGAFVETQLTNYIKLRVAGGYQMINFDSNLLFLDLPNGGFLVYNDQRDLNDYYINALLSHRINSAITQRLSVGHEAQLGINSNYIRLNYVRHTATWNIINRTLLTTEFFYEDAEDSGGFVDEHLHRYGGALSLGYQLTRHVTLGARYQYTRKDSNVPFRDYEQNRVSLDGTYSF
ncbi:MAG: outer membrane beta-barrel protein [Verrucomicrobiota bacterium]|nr:outer membrane beta-barrel protein [Verrucomicrobiota bacterium]